MSSQTQPPSIETFDTESEFTHPDLDLAYIDEVARDVAEIVYQHDGPVAELVYQPGDGTRYPLVIVPLWLLTHATSTRKPGWELHAVSGVMSDFSRERDAPAPVYYEKNAFLVCHVEHACYPLRLGERGRDLAGSYVAEHWDVGETSGVSLAILFRAISFHIAAREARPT